MCTDSSDCSSHGLRKGGGGANQHCGTQRERLSLEVTNSEAVETLANLKKFVGSVAKVFMLLGGNSRIAKVDMLGIEQAILSTSHAGLWRPPLAVVAAINTFRSIECVKNQRWADMVSLLSLATSPLCGLLPAEAHRDHNRGIAKLALARAAPRSGRSVRPPMELCECLLKMSTALVNNDILPEADKKDFELLAVALEDPADYGVDQVNKAIAALSFFTPTAIPETSILASVVSIKKFKECRAACLKAAQARLNELTKGRTIIDAGHEVTKIEEGADVGKTKLHKVLRRAATYVTTLQRPHADIEKYCALMDRLANCVTTSVSVFDRSFQNYLEAVTEQNHEAAEESKREADRVVKGWKAAHFEKELFAHCHHLWQTLDKHLQSLYSRQQVLGKVVDLLPKCSGFAAECGAQTSDVSELVEVMSLLGDLLVQLKHFDIPCDPPVIQAAVGFKNSLKIDSMAIGIYKEQLATLKSVMVRFAEELAKADGDTDVMCDLQQEKVNVQQMLHLSSWSSTPKFDKEALGVLGPLLLLSSTRQAIRKAATQSLSWKQLPTVLGEGYQACLKIAAPGADAVIPKLTFLTGDSQKAEFFFKVADEVSQYVNPAFNKLKGLVDDGLAKQQAVVQSVVMAEKSDMEFLSEFDFKACDAAHKGLKSMLAKAECLEQVFKCQVDIADAMAARIAAQVAINRFAILQLVSRGHINHSTKGKTLRTQLTALWTTVISHKLLSYFGDGLVKQVQAILAQPAQPPEKSGKASKPKRPAREKKGKAATSHAKGREEPAEEEDSGVFEPPLETLESPELEQPGSDADDGFLESEVPEDQASDAP